MVSLSGEISVSFISGQVAHNEYEQTGSSSNVVAGLGVNAFPFREYPTGRQHGTYPASFSNTPSYRISYKYESALDTFCVTVESPCICLYSTIRHLPTIESTSGSGSRFSFAHCMNAKRASTQSLNVFITNVFNQVDIGQPLSVVTQVYYFTSK